MRLPSLVSFPPAAHGEGDSETQRGTGRWAPPASANRGRHGSALCGLRQAGNLSFHCSGSVGWRWGLLHQGSQDD